MDDERRRLIALIVLILATVALLAYRPVLLTIGFDLNHVVPEWAEFFNPRQYAVFLREVDRYFQGREMQSRVHDGVLYVEDGGEYKLRTLAQSCHQVRADRWPALIAAHFAKVRSTAESREGS